MVITELNVVCARAHTRSLLSSALECNESCTLLFINPLGFISSTVYIYKYINICRVPRNVIHNAILCQPEIIATFDSWPLFVLATRWCMRPSYINKSPLQHNNTTIYSFRSIIYSSHVKKTKLSI